MEYLTNIVQGLIYANLLDDHTEFYDVPRYLESHPKEYFKTFVAAMIVLHMENIPSNSISIDEVCGLEGISLLVKEPEILQGKIRGLSRPQVASSVYALSSLINHSCDPNVTRVHDLSGARMAVVSLKGLKAGEELTTSYTKIFLSDTVEERREYLQGLCRGCKKGTDIVALKESLEAKIEAFFEAYELILKNRPVEAIRLLGPCAQFFQDHVCPPYNKIYMSQDLLKTALDLVVHYSVPRT